MGIALPFVPAAGSAGASPLGSMAASTGMQAGMELGAGVLKSLMTGGINNMFAKKQMKLQDKYNRALMDKQNAMQRQLLMDEMPMKAQSYRNAGLSTAALAGQFGGNVSQPMSTAGLVAGSGDGSMALDMGAGISAFKAPSEVTTNKSLAEKAHAEANMTKYQEELSRTFGPASAQTMIDSMSTDMAFRVAQTYNEYVDAASTSARTAADIDIAYKRFNLDAKVASEQMKYYAGMAYQAYKAGKLDEGQYEYTMKSLNKLDKEIEDFDHKWALQDNQSLQLRALAAMYLQQIKNLKKQGKILDANLVRQEYENQVRMVLGPKFRGAMEVANFYLDCAGKIVDIANPFMGSQSTTTTPYGTWSNTTTPTLGW